MDLTVPNQLLGDLKNEISGVYSHDFGSSMLCLDPLLYEGILASHRISKKFEQPSDSNLSKLTEKCYSDWIERDQSYKGFTPKGAHPVLWKARLLLHTWLRDFKPESMVEFTPGETYFSQQGKVSLYQKLRNKKSWTVTFDAFDDFCRLCYNTLMLKRCAKAHFRKRSKLEDNRLYMHYTRLGVKHIGFAIFRHKLERDVVTFVRGSRASTVPKNNDKRRFINVEPLLNMILQRTVAHRLRKVMKTLGNDLSNGQLEHRELISDKTLATIDFENASDSVYLDVVTWMFPPSCAKYLIKYRSFMTKVDGIEYVPNKLSSMGNGFTFEVMSILLLAVGRVLDETTRVYGDDVIIHNLVSEPFLAACEDIGFKVNPTKTFLFSSFRESCGAFYSDDCGYLVTFDFHWLESPLDYIIACNKLAIASYGCGDLRLLEIYERYHSALIRLAPSWLLGPDVSMDIAADYKRGAIPTLSFDSYIYCKKWRRIQVSTRYRKDAGEKDLKRFARGDSCATSLCYKTNEVSHVFCFRFENDQVTPAYKDIRNDPFRYAAYLYSGRRTKDVNRNKGKWIKFACLALPNGNVLKLSEQH